MYLEGVNMKLCNRNKDEGKVRFLKFIFAFFSLSRRQTEYI